MKVLTKKLNYDLDLHDLQCVVDSIAKRTMPVVFFNGGHEGVAESDIRTLKTNLNVTDKENEIKFMILPASFTFFTDCFESVSPEEDFISEYTHRLRIISGLPEDILKQVKDKRLLAMGYAEPKVKRSIIKYAKSKKTAALKVYERSIKESIDATTGLTIEEQFGAQHRYVTCRAVKNSKEQSAKSKNALAATPLYTAIGNGENFCAVSRNIVWRHGK